MGDAFTRARKDTEADKAATARLATLRDANYSGAYTELPLPPERTLEELLGKLEKGNITGKVRVFLRQWWEFPVVPVTNPPVRRAKTFFQKMFLRPGSIDLTLPPVITFQRATTAKLSQWLEFDLPRKDESLTFVTTVNRETPDRMIIFCRSDLASVHPDVESVRGWTWAR